MGRLDPSPAITAMVESNSLLEREVSNPLVWTCLTISRFETQDLDLQRPAWLPRLQAGGQGWPQHIVSRFSELGDCKRDIPSGDLFFLVALRVRRTGAGQAGGEAAWAAEPRAFSILHLAGTTETSATFCLSPGLSPHCPGASPWGCVPLYRGNWRLNLAFPAGKAVFPHCMCNISAFMEFLFLCLSALLSPR